MQFKQVVETNLIRVTKWCMSCYFYIKSHLKQLYISNKTKYFSYEDGYDVYGHNSEEIQSKA